MKISKSPRVAELVKAAWNGDIAVAKRLLAHGADPNAVPEDGTESAFWAAVYTKSPQMICVLAEGRTWTRASPIRRSASPRTGGT